MSRGFFLFHCHYNEIIGLVCLVAVAVLESGPSSLASDAAGPVSFGSESNKENVSPDNGSSTPAPVLPTPTRLLQLLQEQIRVLRRAADSLAKQGGAKDPSVVDGAPDSRDTTESDVAELQEQIVKLKGIRDTREANW